MVWACPVPYYLVPTIDSDSFDSFSEDETGLPMRPHKGAFGVARKYHTHEGVDLYVPEHTPITAVEDSVVVDIQPFTGLIADPPTPFWEDTWAVLAEGTTGVVVYGEVIPNSDLKVGSGLAKGDLVGFVKRVLRVDKGRPISMLHLELHDRGTRVIPAWEGQRPKTLRDPTDFLLYSEQGTYR